jgi:excisionase family DNA binding protein
METAKEQLLTARECAEQLNISRATLSRLIAKKAIAYYRVGLRTMFGKNQISDYLRSVECPQDNSHSNDRSDSKEVNDEEV